MTKKRCPLGEACDLTTAWMAAQEAEIERLAKDKRWIINDRDRTFALMLSRAEKAEAKLAKAVEALLELIDHTHNCEKELTEELHNADFCGESLPLTNARTTLAELKGQGDD